MDSPKKYFALGIQIGFSIHWDERIGRYRLEVFPENPPPPPSRSETRSSDKSKTFDSQLSSRRSETRSQWVSNEKLKGTYHERAPNAILLYLKAPESAPFEIEQEKTDVRSYVLEKTTSFLGVIAPPFRISTDTAHYQTRPRAQPAAEQDLVSYVEALMDVANTISKQESEKNWNFSSISFKDENDPLIKKLLKEMTRRYAAGIQIPEGHEHGYRQVDENRPEGKAIKNLASYLNRSYGLRLKGEEQKSFVSDLFVDEKGVLFYASIWNNPRRLGEPVSFRSVKFNELMGELGKNLVNQVEIRSPEAIELVETKIQGMDDLHRTDPSRRFAFTRAVSDYEPQELLIRDERKARSARLVWALWTSLLDIHYYNSLNVGAAPVEFDFDKAFSLGPAQDIKIEHVASALVFYLLAFTTPEMDPYLQIEGYDFPAIGKTIQSIVGWKELEETVKKVGYKAGAFTGGWSFDEEGIYHYLDYKRAHEGEWLWKAAASALGKLTGTELSVEQLKEKAGFSARAEVRSEEWPEMEKVRALGAKIRGLGARLQKLQKPIGHAAFEIFEKEIVRLWEDRDRLEAIIQAGYAPIDVLEAHQLKDSDELDLLKQSIESALASVRQLKGPLTRLENRLKHKLPPRAGVRTQGFDQWRQYPGIEVVVGGQVREVASGDDDRLNVTDEKGSLIPGLI